MISYELYKTNNDETTITYTITLPPLLITMSFDCTFFINRLPELIQKIKQNGSFAFRYNQWNIKLANQMVYFEVEQTDFITVGIAAHEILRSFKELKKEVCRVEELFSSMEL